MRIQKMKLWTAMLLSGAVFAQPASAQESRVATQALRCSAYFVVFSGSADVQNFADYFVDAYRRENSAASSDDVRQRRELVLTELEKNSKTNAAAVLEEAVLCGAWAEGFRLQGDSPMFTPLIPKIIPQKVRDDYAALAAAAFEKWQAEKAGKR